MELTNLSFPRQSVFLMLQSQPEHVLIDLFEELIVKSDTTPLNSTEKKEIDQAVKDYHDGKTIEWTK
ncbi:MAG: hypothetical protein HW421_2366 [Ignavibacteria bacterium]|nr:hypothetical protein [Ignavibacteria bacterium]